MNYPPNELDVKRIQEKEEISLNQAWRLAHKERLLSVLRVYEFTPAHINVLRRVVEDLVERM